MNNELKKQVKIKGGVIDLYHINSAPLFVFKNNLEPITGQRAKELMESRNEMNRKDWVDLGRKEISPGWNIHVYGNHYTA